MFDCGNIDYDKRHEIKKADIFFLSGIVIAALIIFILMRLNSTTGSYVTVSYGGSELLAQSPLEQSETRYFLIIYPNEDIGIINNENVDNVNTNDKNAISGKIDDISVNENRVNIQEYSEAKWEEVWEEMQLTNVEYNAFLYKDQEISMLYGSCPDKICVHHKPISMTGENIICLPHKLVIDIVDDKSNSLDGMAY